jgi:hypothetical protein
MNKFYSFLIAVTPLLFSFSCSRNETSPLKIFPNKFTITENAIKGRIVDTLTLYHKKGEQKYLYEIVGGNTDNVFAVQCFSGILTVYDPGLLDFESTPEYNLKIKVSSVEDPARFYISDIEISVTDVPPIEEDLLGYYRFNGNGKDETGNCDAMVVNGAYNSDSFFDNSPVLSLNGYCYADLNTGFDFSKRSISVWFKANTISTSMTIIFNSDYEGALFGLSALAVKEVDGVDYLEFNYSGASYYTPISENTWYHAVEVFDNLSCTYYLNDKVILNTTAASYLSSDQGYEKTVIGANRYYDRKLNGYIKDVRLYKRALTAEEVHTLYLEK